MPKSLPFVFDFAQPESYLAYGPTVDLARELAVEIEWLPTTVPKKSPPTPEGNDDDRTARHMRLRARDRERMLERYARVKGLSVGNLYREVDSRLAGASVLWLVDAAPDRVSESVGRIFQGLWHGALDIESRGELRGMLESLGLPVVDFDPADGEDRYDQVQEKLREAGVIGAPGYLIEGEFFLGRAHLPMVRWLLQGRSGAPPI
jgi:2-hydroxychromene-2-carboxylate isomerase